MKNKIILLLLSFIILSGCKTDTREQPFDSFVYSYAAMDMEYSIKFNEGDTVYFQKRYPKPASNYFAVVKDAQRDSIIALASQVDFAKYDSLYVDPTLSDAEKFKFYKQKDNKIYWVYVADRNGPKELFKLAIQFNEFAKHLNFQPYNGKIDFGNLKHIELPTPPPMPAN